MSREFTGIGRDKLILTIEHLRAENGIFRKELEENAVLMNRSAESIERLTKAHHGLLEENGRLRAAAAKLAETPSAISIRGWWCNCNAFNGEERSPRDTCRACGVPKMVRT